MSDKQQRYIFSNGDKIIIGLNTYQCLDGELKKVDNFVNVGDQLSRTFYVKPGTIFNYEIKEKLKYE